MAWFGVCVPRDRAIGIALSAVLMGLLFSVGAAASVLPNVGLHFMQIDPSAGAVLGRGTLSGVTLVGACRGPDCDSPYSDYESGEPAGACRPSYDDDEEEAPPPPRYIKECGVRCMYQRLREGYCGPGCDYYLFRMYEYRYGRPPRKRRCDRE
jgi:hypothetical protein